ncbi:peptidase C39 family protein [Bifidobacterium sp. SO1]|uniref:peptidase C39 family protein n=1 Tax=Bifidobacterium sp. SO1 TaxID=2809029 RepID=UPI001BDC97A1|nr:peptidase C39 family protein [Bifidobacterium sp. SO1]MBT1160591.1 peptidase C39 family protein [Bifidobacterium sp. SO1]
MTRYFARAVVQGHAPREIDGVAIPESTVAALAKAGGVLVRTVYLAVDDGRGDAGSDERRDERGADNAPAVAALLGYHRPHTVQQKLTAIGGERRLWRGLVAFAEQETLRDPDIAVIKYDLVRSDAIDAAGNGTDDVNSGADGRTASGSGLTPGAESAPEPQTPADLPRTAGAAAHYRQTTEFTCGPVAVLTAMYRLGLAPRPTRAEELQMWRDATIAVACEPYGLALAATRRGAHPSIRVSAAGPVLHPDSRLGILDPAMARDTQIAFERQAREQGIDVQVAPFDASDIAALVDAGHVAVVLIDELHMHGEACPHWVTVTGRDPASGALLIDDPWTDAEYGETGVDAWQLPVRPEDFDLMIRYDAPRSAQAMLVF